MRRRFAVTKKPLYFTASRAKDLYAMAHYNLVCHSDQITAKETDYSCYWNSFSPNREGGTANRTPHITYLLMQREGAVQHFTLVEAVKHHPKYTIYSTRYQTPSNLIKSNPVANSHHYWGLLWNREREKVSKLIRIVLSLSQRKVQVKFISIP